MKRQRIKNSRDKQRINRFKKKLNWCEELDPERVIAVMIDRYSVYNIPVFLNVFKCSKCGLTMERFGFDQKNNPVSICRDCNSSDYIQIRKALLIIEMKTRLGIE